MSNNKAVLSLALLVMAVTAAGLTSAAPQRGRPAPVALPPLSQTCPMHPDVVETTPGNCPICKMKLVPVRLESVWSCPIHPVVAESKAGTCPICKRPLVQMTMALTWTCTGHPDIDQIERGVCADGSAMIARRTLRPHGNHNPQHGGEFFMAPDNTHHLEGAYPQPRQFRLYLYDDYARPLPAAQIKAVQARVVTKETFDPATRTTREIAAARLRVVPGGGYLEARIDAATLPAQMSAKVRFKPGDPEYRFDFAFPALSKDPAPAAAVRPSAATATATPARRSPATRTAVRRATPAVSAPAAARPAAPAIASAAPDNGIADNGVSLPASPDADPSLVPQPIPDNVPEIIAHLQTRTTQIAALIERSNFTAVYVPAFQAKDLAIALEERLDGLPADRRQRAEPAIQGLVRTAWLLDAVGDLGNREQITSAYAAFSASVSEVVSAFAPAP